VARSASTPAGTAARILDAAERMVQVRGFNGFSYADVAAELGLTTAALHYHFAGKAELGEAMVSRYAERFAGRLRELDAAGGAAPARLDGYGGLYLSVLLDRRMCLCGMLAAEYHTLPAGMRAVVLRFFDDNESWLEMVLEQGASEGTLRYPGPARDAARMLISGLEGAMLVAHSFGDVGRFTAAVTCLLAGLAGTGAGARADGLRNAAAGARLLRSVPPTGPVSAR
jgi:TetR/AcrR family transcriptional regulator, transcriptional repressor for nem operon